MKKLVVWALCLVIGVELMAITSDRRLVLLVPGVALAAVLLALRRFLVGEVEPRTG